MQANTFGAINPCEWSDGHTGQSSLVAHLHYTQTEKQDTVSFVRFIEGLLQ